MMIKLKLGANLLCEGHANILNESFIMSKLFDNGVGPYGLVT